MCSLVVLALVLVNGELNITVLAYHWTKLYRHESDVSLLINLSKKSELCKTANPVFHSSAPIQVCKSFFKNNFKLFYIFCGYQSISTFCLNLFLLIHISANPIHAVHRDTPGCPDLCSAFPCWVPNRQFTMYGSLHALTADHNPMQHLNMYNYYRWEFFFLSF